MSTDSPKITMHRDARIMHVDTLPGTLVPGTIYVVGSNEQVLLALPDATSQDLTAANLFGDLSGATEGQVLAFDNATSRFIAVDPSGGGGGGGNLGSREARFSLPILVSGALNVSDSGSGAVNRFASNVEIRAATTAGYAELYGMADGMDFDGAEALGVNALGRFAVATDDCDMWIGIDRGVPQTNGYVLSGEGFGFLFKRVSGTITIEADSFKNGIGQTTTDVTGLVSGLQSDHLWSIESDAAGTRFIVDGTVVADHSTHVWPLTDITATHSMIRTGVTNRNTAGQGRIYLKAWETWVRYPSN